MVGRLRERPTGRISQKFSFKLIIKMPPTIAAKIKIRVRILPSAAMEEA